MRHLTESKVMNRAAVAAILTALACYPRLMLWLERPYAVLPMCIMMFVCTFVLWAFAFAWQKPYAGREVISIGFDPRIWMAATVLALVWGAALHFLIDPQMRLVTPKEFPDSWTSWIAMALFSLALDPLFFTFAPFAFFMRLFRQPRLCMALTVLFGVFVLFLKLRSGAKLPPMSLALELTALRVAGGFVGLFFYLRGGALVVWWMVLIQQSRHAFDLAASH
jgi:hypothetical protein